MQRYKVTIYVRSDEDPSYLLDELDWAIRDRDDMELDPGKVASGEAVSVENDDD